MKSYTNADDENVHVVRIKLIGLPGYERLIAPTYHETASWLICGQLSRLFQNFEHPLIRPHCDRTGGCRFNQADT